MINAELLPTNDPSKFTLKFGGPTRDINAATYGQILVNTVTLLEEANKELQTGVQIEIRVHQEREGSWIVDLAINSLASFVALTPLMTPENIAIAKDTAKKVATIATESFNVWKKLKGEKPAEIRSEGDNVTIITGDHNTIITDKSTGKLVLENKRSQDALATSFGALSQDQSVESFDILGDGEQKLFESTRSEFAILSKRPPRLLPDKNIETESIHLYIVRPSFEQNLNSDFVYRGIRISVAITDAGFWEKIDRGERFGKGDILFVELQIQQEFNKSLNTYENKAYTVTRVHQHIPRPEQPELDGLRDSLSE